MTAYSVTARPIKARSRVRQGRGLAQIHVDRAKGYRNAHTRIKRLRGRAVSYVCADCDATFADTWSYNGDSPFEQSGYETVSTPAGPVQTFVRWSGNPWDYSPRCRPCHRAYDAADRARRKAELDLDRLIAQGVLS